MLPPQIFNEQVHIPQDFANFGMTSPTRSLRSANCHTSPRLSEAERKLRPRETRMEAAKAALAAKQTYQKQRRSMEIEVKRLEMEINQKQLEFEMVELDAKQDVAEVKKGND